MARCPTTSQIILVRNPLTSASQWQLSRITVYYSGDLIDDLIRVITVKTGPGIQATNCEILFSTRHGGQSCR